MFKLRKKILSFLAGSFFLFTVVSANELSLAPCPELDPDVFQQLVEKGEVRKQHFKEDGADFTLFPKTELGASLKETWTERKAPVFVAESLFLIEKPEGFDTGKLDTDLISRIMRSISSMEGGKIKMEIASGIFSRICFAP